MREMKSKIANGADSSGNGKRDICGGCAAPHNRNARPVGPLTKTGVIKR